MKISRRILANMINKELAIEALDWSNVGGDARRWMGGMNLAKYPGPWASGHESLVTEDDEPEWVEDDENDTPDWSDSESIRHPDRKRQGKPSQRRRRGSKDASFSFQHGEPAEAELLRNVQILRDVRTAFRGSDSESCSFDFSRILMDIYAAYDAFVEVYGEKLPSPESGEEFLMYGKVDINILNKIDDALDYIEENPLECGYKRRWFEDSRSPRSEERQWATFMYLGINAMMPRRRGRGIMNLQRELGCVSWEYLCTLSEEEQDRITALHPICPADRVSAAKWKDCPDDIREHQDFKSKLHNGDSMNITQQRLIEIINEEISRADLSSVYKIIVEERRESSREDRQQRRRDRRARLRSRIGEVWNSEALQEILDAVSALGGTGVLGPQFQRIAVATSLLSLAYAGGLGRDEDVDVDGWDMLSEISVALAALGNSGVIDIPAALGNFTDQFANAAATGASANLLRALGGGETLERAICTGGQDHLTLMLQTIIQNPDSTAGEVDLAQAQLDAISAINPDEVDCE